MWAMHVPWEPGTRCTHVVYPFTSAPFKKAMMNDLLVVHHATNTCVHSASSKNKDTYKVTIAE